MGLVGDGKNIRGKKGKKCSLQLENECNVSNLLTLSIGTNVRNILSTMF